MEKKAEPIKKLPIYSLVIDPEDMESGVDFVALVDHPAIEKTWMAFSENREHKFIGNPDRQIITGPLMIPDMPIYRQDDMGEYYVVFTKDTVWQIVQKYFKNGFTSNVNMMHDPKQKLSDVFMFESFIVDKSRGILPPNGHGNLPDGTWFGSYKVNNADVWDNFVKTGVFTGFSVEGIFEQKYLVEKNQDQLENIASRILAMRKEIAKLKG